MEFRRHSLDAVAQFSLMRCQLSITSVISPPVLALCAICSYVGSCFTNYIMRECVHGLTTNKLPILHWLSTVLPQTATMIASFDVKNYVCFIYSINSKLNQTFLACVYAVLLIIKFKLVLRGFKTGWRQIVPHPNLGFYIWPNRLKNHTQRTQN